ncbi:MAG: hypothetical protein HOH64_17645 [Rhodospirillales bacterium]|nr:hypothetical protein [Rhodospirillales bacterium]MBT5520908.1 hypothetical protein [Rhodospirillales bacterium]MBT6111916.1 hypothetical protein [Rhodospirillales bacterium]MBT6826240.1 hypothetical protein [Rhodospirillales bacterium]MBT7148413.1 hypothetical protein [Rhodospirillales bacterium]
MADSLADTPAVDNLVAGSQRMLRVDNQQVVAQASHQALHMPVRPSRRGAAHLR